MSIKDTAKTILCFGDSNTWGARPDSDERYPRSVRWPSVLQKLLSDDYEVINEGLVGRTLVANDPAKPYRTGVTHLTALLKTHEPVDLIIIMLGTNDVKVMYNLSDDDIAEHLEQTIKLIREEKESLPIIVVCPPAPVTPKEGEIDSRMARAPEIFKILPKLFKEVSEKSGCIFLNAGDYISSSYVDGYHLDAEAHVKLASAIRDIIKTIKF